MGALDPLTESNQLLWSIIIATPRRVYKNLKIVDKKKASAKQKVMQLDIGNKVLNCIVLGWLM